MNRTIYALIILLQVVNSDANSIIRDGFIIVPQNKSFWIWFLRLRSYCLKQNKKKKKIDFFEHFKLLRFYRHLSRLISNILSSRLSPWQNRRSPTLARKSQVQTVASFEGESEASRQLVCRKTSAGFVNHPVRIGRIIPRIAGDN